MGQHSHRGDTQKIPVGLWVALIQPLISSYHLMWMEIVISPGLSGIGATKWLQADWNSD